MDRTRGTNRPTTSAEALEVERQARVRSLLRVARQIAGQVETLAGAEPGTDLRYALDALAGLLAELAREAR